MDQLPLLGSGLKAATPSFFLDIDPTASVSALPPETAQAPPFTATEPSSKSSYNRGPDDTIKAKILSHPLYPALLRAFIDCRKVGAPPEVVGRLSSLADELESNSDEMQEQRQADPALDQFMETYLDVLVTYSQELSRQIQEANEFIWTMEAHIDSFALANGNSCECWGSSEDEQEIGDVAGLPITGPSGEGKELTNQPLDKYSGYVRRLWRELSGKKKNGRLPRDARQKLLRWWQLHSTWPYPSELEKSALAESTGLDMKQITNWFINQRKRHWRPTALTVNMGTMLHHINGAPSSSPQDLCMEVRCFTQRSGSTNGRH